MDLALVCIGGHYTMDREDAAVAAELVGAPQGDPCRYNTFPAIETDAQAFKADVEKRTGGRTTVEVLDPGGTFLSGSPAPRRNQTGRSFQSCAIQHGAEQGEQHASGCRGATRWPAIHTRAAGEVQTDHAITVCPWS